MTNDNSVNKSTFATIKKRDREREERVKELCYATFFNYYLGEKDLMLIFMQKKKKKVNDNKS